MAIYGVGLRAQVDAILHDSKNKLFQNYGVRGTFCLLRSFKKADTHETGLLMLNEFEDSLKSVGLFYTRDQMHNLCNYYGNECKQMPYQKFVNEYKTELSERKMSAIRQVFEKLDSNKNGSIEVTDLESKFVTQSMVGFISGKLNQQEAFNEFLSLFDTNKDGMVTMQEFEEFYAYVGALVSSDDQFELHVKNTWNIELYSDKKEVEENAIFFVKMTHKALQDLLKGEDNDFKLNQLYASFDPHGAQVLHVEEFRKMCGRLKLPEPAKSVLVKAFGMIDTDGDGGIQIDEFKNFIFNGAKYC